MIMKISPSLWWANEWCFVFHPWLRLLTVGSMALCHNFICPLTQFIKHILSCPEWKPHPEGSDALVYALRTHYFVMYVFESQTCKEWSFSRNNLWRERRENKKGDKKDGLLSCSVEGGYHSQKFLEYLVEKSRMGANDQTSYISVMCKPEGVVQNTVLLWNCVFLFQLSQNCSIIS